MRAFEIVENHGPVTDMLLKLRKGMAASLNATKLTEIFNVLNDGQPGWKIEKSKSYKLSDGGWVLKEVGNGIAKKFDRGYSQRGSGRILCATDMPRELDKYNAWGGGEDKQRERQAEAQAKYESLKKLGEELKRAENGPEKGKWFVRNVDISVVQHPEYEGLSDLVVSFELYVLTSGFTITSPDGQTYEVFGDYKNGAIGATTFQSWFAWAVENTEIMDQILNVLQMEAHEKKQDPKARYTPPPGSPAEVTRIFEVLKKLTDDVRDQQKERLISAWKRAVMDFVEAINSRDEKKARGLIESHFGFIISRCYSKRDKKLADDWETEVDKLAEDAVEEMQNVFVYKNTRKLASIATAKTGMEEPKVASVSTQGGVITATLRFAFNDGSSFRVDQSVVYSTSVRGTPFYRFPTTFHDVILPDGSKMGYPSEERMNEVFAKA